MSHVLKKNSVQISVQMYMLSTFVILEKIHATFIKVMLVNIFKSSVAVCIKLSSYQVILNANGVNIRNILLKQLNILQDLPKLF